MHCTVDTELLFGDMGDYYYSLFMNFNHASHTKSSLNLVQSRFTTTGFRKWVCITSMYRTANTTVIPTFATRGYISAAHLKVTGDERFSLSLIFSVCVFYDYSVGSQSEYTTNYRENFHKLKEDKKPLRGVAVKLPKPDLKQR